MKRRTVRVAGVLVALAVAFLGGSALVQSGHAVVGVAVAAAALLAAYLAFAPSSSSAAEHAHAEAWGRPVKPDGFERPRGGRDLL
jgi:hypothetical protein